MRTLPELNLPADVATAARLRRLADFGADSFENHWLRRQARKIERALLEART